MDTQIPIGDIERQLHDIIRRAELGETFVLTRDGQPILRVAPTEEAARVARRLAILEDISSRGAAKITPGPDAAHSQDWLYDDKGLPT